MKWSYSRIHCFEDCKYQWFLKYIKMVESTEKFFRNYGLYMHHILEQYLGNKLQKEELVDYYILNYRQNVLGKPPTLKIYNNYFNKGINYLSNIEFPHRNILGVEQEVNFNIGDKKFVGIIDVISNDDGIAIIDHKSRDLKPRSNRKKPIKSDVELDNYLKQPYLYSIYIKEKYGEYPKSLEYNCFKSQVYITEPFNEQKLEETKQWALDKIATIESNEDWKPSLDVWKCNHICDVCDSCEYKELL